MSEHKTRIDLNELGHRAVCSCRQQQPDRTTNRHDAEDWIYRHEQQVQRAQAHLQPVPSLKKTLEYYAEKMATTLGTEQKQWKLLHDELQHRLGTGAVETEPLFDIPVRKP